MIIYLTKSVFRGKTLVRSMMNKELSYYTLCGKTLDVGGGKDPSYMKFLKKGKSFQLSCVDIETGKNGLKLDLEKDILPFENNSHNVVLMMNFLEHVYNYQHVVNEAYRVIEKGGRLIGFVPFLVNVHPDPHDYFRYTNESLQKIFIRGGFKEIKIKPIGYGPFAVYFNTLVSVISGKYIFWQLPLVIFLDKVILSIRPQWKKRFPLGYLFELKK